MAHTQVGTETLRTVQDKCIFFSNAHLAEHIPGIHTIDSTYAYDGANTSYERELRKGTIMAKITSSGQWVPCKRTVVATGGGATAQAIPVVDARAFKAGDTISVGSDTGKTIASVNYSTNTITVSDTAFAFADGEAVIGSGALAGSEIARAILNEFVDLWDDRVNAVRDMATGALCFKGNVDDDQVLGDLTAIRAATNYIEDHIVYKSDLGL